MVFKVMVVRERRREGEREREFLGDHGHDH
jgi:hypothetical protein